LRLGGAHIEIFFLWSGGSGSFHHQRQLSPGIVSEGRLMACEPRLLRCFAIPSPSSVNSNGRTCSSPDSGAPAQERGILRCLTFIDERNLTVCSLWNTDVVATFSLQMSSRARLQD
jgi:hypothetical protein